MSDLRAPFLEDLRRIGDVAEEKPMSDEMRHDRTQTLAPWRRFGLLENLGALALRSNQEEGEGEAN